MRVLRAHPPELRFRAEVMAMCPVADRPFAAGAINLPIVMAPAHPAVFLVEDDCATIPTRPCLPDELPTVRQHALPSVA